MQNFIKSIDTYDESTNMYYKSINNKNTKDKDEKSMFSKIKQPSSKVINLAIINTQEDTYKLLFNRNEEVNISFIQFEMLYDEKNQKIKFEDEHLHIRNNKNIERRGMKDKLLIGLKVDETLELWVSDKKGNSLAKIVRLNEDESWHLDVKNSKIRVISAVNSEFLMQSFEW